MMYLTYNKSLPAFYQELVQLEMDVPDTSKVYVGFQEGFVPLAAKYYEALAAVAEAPMFEPTKEEVIEALATVEAPVEEAIVEEPVEAPVEEAIVEEEVIAVDAPVVKRTRRATSV